MKALLAAMCVMFAASSEVSNALTSQLLVGRWRSDLGSTYYFHANGTWDRDYADFSDGGRWRLRGQRQIELTYIIDNKVSRREIVAVDRVVHETLYVRTGEAREVWLKQPSS